MTVQELIERLKLMNPTLKVTAIYNGNPIEDSSPIVDVFQISHSFDDDFNGVIIRIE